MIDSNRPSEPITEWDLALYAEHGLDDARHQQVAEFLDQHPQLKTIVGTSDAVPSSGDGRRLLTAADSRPGDDRVTVADLPTPASDADEVRRPHNAGEDSSRRTFRRRLLTAVSLVAAVVLVTSGVEFLGRTQADSPLLREIEAGFRDGRLQADFHELTLARGRLEGIDPQSLSTKDQQLRQYLMAMVLIGEAESKFTAKRPVQPGEVTPTEPPLATLTQRAIATLTSLQADRPELKPELARAWSLHGRIHFRFAVSVRSQRRVDAAEICRAFQRALELMPDDDPQRWRVASLLLKTIYKLTPRHDAVQRDAIAKVVNDVFPKIEVDPDQLSESIIVRLAQMIQQQPPDSEPVRIAQIEVASILTMGGRFGLYSESAANSIDQTLAMAEAHCEGASEEFQLVYGQLLGNLADSCRFEDLEQAVQLGRRALEVLEQIVEDNHSDLNITELDWVTARLLISEYRYSRRHPEEESQVKVMIGALRHTEFSLKHFETLQLAPWEIDVINAIKASFSKGQPSQQKWAEGILRNYKAKQLGDAEIRVLCEELADLPAFRDSRAFQEFLDLQPTQL